MRLGSADERNLTHPFVAGSDAENWRRFENMIVNPEIRDQKKPYRADMFILISAGKDGLYGTADDIANFEWRYREPTQEEGK